MRIGLDIASPTLKRHVDIIILVSGDADFVPAAKLARREGVQFVLDPLWQTEPRRDSRRLISLSQAAMADPCSV